MGALLSPHALHGLRGGDVCLDVTSPSSALGSKPPSLTRIARLETVQFNLLFISQYNSFKNNFVQQFLSYIKLYSFFVVYVHYPFTPSLLLTQTLHKRISQKDYTKRFHCVLQRSKNTLNVARLLLIPKFVPMLKIVFLFTLR